MIYRFLKKFQWLECPRHFKARLNNYKTGMGFTSSMQMDRINYFNFLSLSRWCVVKIPVINSGAHSLFLNLNIYRAAWKFLITFQWDPILGGPKVPQRVYRLPWKAPPSQFSLTPAHSEIPMINGEKPDDADLIKFSSDLRPEPEPELEPEHEPEHSSFHYLVLSARLVSKTFARVFNFVFSSGKNRI